MTRVVVVDDHTLVRQSLVKAIAMEPGFEVAGDAGRGDEAVGLVRSRRPDMVVLDIDLPGQDGFQVAQEIRSALPGVRILFLTMHDDEAHIREALRLGADGYVPKTASTEELLQAVRTIAAGDSYLSPSVAGRVMRLAGGSSTGHASRLTEREAEILRLLATGARTQEVADSVFLSVKTVKNHLTSIYAKLGVQTASQAVAAAYRAGLVSRDPAMRRSSA